MFTVQQIQCVRKQIREHNETLMVGNNLPEEDSRLGRTSSLLAPDVTPEELQWDVQFQETEMRYREDIIARYQQQKTIVHQGGSMQDIGTSGSSKKKPRTTKNTVSNNMLHSSDHWWVCPVDSICAVQERIENEFRGCFPSRPYLLWNTYCLSGRVRFTVTVCCSLSTRIH